MAGKTAVKKEKKGPVLTKQACADCGERLTTATIQTVYVMSFSGAKSSKTYDHRHKGCKGVVVGPAH
jgi:hypothetical protein